MIYIIIYIVSFYMLQAEEYVMIWAGIMLIPALLELYISEEESLLRLENVVSTFAVLGIIGSFFIEVPLGFTIVSIVSWGMIFIGK